MKRCYTCNRILPLCLFTSNKRKYQNATNKGRNYCCRLCLYKRWSADGWAWLWNRQAGKYERREFGGRFNIIKHLLR